MLNDTSEIKSVEDFVFFLSEVKKLPPTYLIKGPDSFGPSIQITKLQNGHLLAKFENDLDNFSENVIHFGVDIEEVEYPHDMSEDDKLVFLDGWISCQLEHDTENITDFFLKIRNTC